MANSIRKHIHEEQVLISLPPGEIPLTDDEKIREIRFHFARIMETLGLDLNDDSLRDTPQRVAKMFVKEIFSGLNEENFPSISLFENRYGYNEMLVEKNIGLFSWCEHHFVPIIGKAHVAYYPNEKVIGLSKINRLVQYYARRPQVQERLTTEIAEGLRFVLQTEDVAVYVQATHLCVAARGVQDTASSTATSSFSGRFCERENKEAFYAAFK